MRLSVAYNYGRQPPDSDDEESDDDDDREDFFGFNAGYDHRGNALRAADEALHNIIRAMLALSYEPAPLAAIVEGGVTARLARMAAAGPPAIAALLAIDTSHRAPSEQAAEALRAPLVTVCGLLVNILTSAGHLAWPETSRQSKAVVAAAATKTRVRAKHSTAPTYPVLGHPAMGDCLASLAEVAGLAGAARRAGGGARWRLLAAHSTLVVLTVARVATPGNGLAPARNLAERKLRWGGDDADGSEALPRGNGGARSGVGGGCQRGSGTIWEAMLRADNEALGSLTATPGRGLIGGAMAIEDDEEASYEEGSIWQWCLECAREIDASAGGAPSNPYVACGVVPRGLLRSLAEASSDGRI